MILQMITVYMMRKARKLMYYGRSRKLFDISIKIVAGQKQNDGDGVCMGGVCWGLLRSLPEDGEDAVHAGQVLFHAGGASQEVV